MNLVACWKNPFIYQFEQIHIVLCCGYGFKIRQQPKNKNTNKEHYWGDNRTGIHLIRTIVLLPADKCGGLWRNSGTVHTDLLCVVMIYGHVSNTICDQAFTVQRENRCLCIAIQYPKPKLCFHHQVVYTPVGKFSFTTRGLLGDSFYKLGNEHLGEMVQSWEWWGMTEYRMVTQDQAKIKWSTHFSLV